MTLYRDVRPTTFDEVIGQDQAVSVLKTKIANGTLPNVVLLVGNTGTGKTTLARIVATELGMTNPEANLREVDCAEDRSIELAREVKEVYRYAAAGGTCRVWIMDEVVQFPRVTQQAFLSILEDTPKHCYFLLCSSDVTGLLPTFLGRCFRIDLELLSKSSIRHILDVALQNLGVFITDDRTLEQIALRADGNARKALTMLEMILSSDDPKKQMDLARSYTDEQDKRIEFLALALLKQGSWPDIAKILNDCDNAYGLRLQVMSYMSKVILGNAPLAKKEMADRVISAIQFATDMPTLVHACWLLSKSKT